MRYAVVVVVFSFVEGGEFHDVHLPVGPVWIGSQTVFEFLLSIIDRINRKISVASFSARSIVMLRYKEKDTIRA